MFVWVGKPHSSFKKGGFTRSLLGVDNWGPHLEHPFTVAAKDANAKVVFLPGGTTELTAFTN